MRIRVLQSLLGVLYIKQEIMWFHVATLGEYKGLHKCMQFFVFVVISLWLVDDE